MRALDLCHLAGGQLARARAQAATEPAVGGELAGVGARVEIVVEAIRAQPKVGTGTLPADAALVLDHAITTLHGVAGRMTGIQPEAGDG